MHGSTSVAKAPVAIEQKSAKALSTAGVIRRTSLQLTSVSTEAKDVSREAKQVPHEPKTAQAKQMWKAKQKSSSREALGEVDAQLRLSCEDKGKTPLSLSSIADASREADLESQEHEFALSSPNPRALIPSANFAPMTGVKGVF